MLREADCFTKTAGECRRPGGLELTLRGLALCGFSERARIADIGCGTGASVRLLRERGYCCIGLDLRAQSGDFPHIRGRAETLPFARESLHGIVCECVLSLLRNPGRVLKGFWEACRVDARLLLTDIYRKDSERSPLVFSRRELEAALHDAGWRVTRFEDCSRALREFVARSVWYAEGDAAPWARSVPGGNSPRRARGYGLWTARKEGR